MGSATATVEEAVEALVASGEGSACVKVRLYRPFSGSISSPPCRPTAGGLPCSIGRRSRARSASRSTMDVVAAAQPTTVATAGHRSPADRDRRALRTRVEGVHAGDGRRPCSIELDAPRPQRHFTVGIADDVTGSSLAVDAGFDVEPERRRARRLLRARRATARSARTRIRSRSSAKKPAAMRRAISSTTRRSRVRSPSRICVSARRRFDAPYLIEPRRLRRLSPVQLPRTHRRAETARARWACSC